MSDNNRIIVVSGLPRSGTSLMMQILQAAGIPLLTDNERPADSNNPKGYFEFERVKSLPNDIAWLPDARGKAVKIISHLLYHLPDTYSYAVIFMNRDLDEIIQSQNKMLQKMNQPLGQLSRIRLKERFALHLQKIHWWLSARPNFVFQDVRFSDLIFSPHSELRKVWQFLGTESLTEAVLPVIDSGLYRNRTDDQGR